MLYNEVCVSFQWAKFYFRVFIEKYYDDDSFLETEIAQEYYVYREQILETASNKIAAVQPCTSYL